MEQIIARALAGDREAFAQVYDAYAPAALRIGKAVTGDGELAADAVQEAFLRVYKKGWQCRDPKQFRAWFFRIVINESRRVLRAGRREVQGEVWEESATFAEQSDLSVTVQAAAFIETLFPPKEVTAMPEGQGGTAVYQPRGEEAAETEPGFVLWVDEERYQVTETEEAFRVWPLNWDGTLPDCDLTVRHLPETPPETAAEEVRAALAADYAETGEPAETTAGLLVTASDGTAWNDRQAEVHIRSDGRAGSFTITIRYFTEAAEGHGARFQAMLETFAVVQNEK